MNKQSTNAFAQALLELKALKEKDDQSSFNLYMEKVIPQIQKYLQRQLELAINRHNIPQGKYKVEDFIDELYIRAFDHIHNINESEHFKVWLYREADSILNDTLTDEEFDDFFMKNLTDYTHEEWDEMEEKYSIDGGGDFVMEEELDDLSYSKNDYVLNDVFVENEEKQMIEDLDDKLSQDRINQHIEVLLSKLPIITSSILELYSIQKLKEEEIAVIKKIPIEEVKFYLGEAKKLIRITLNNRYQF